MSMHRLQNFLFRLNYIFSKKHTQEIYREIVIVLRLNVLVKWIFHRRRRRCCCCNSVLLLLGFFCCCCCCIFTLVLLLICILFSVPLIIYFFFVVLIHFVFFAICESNHNCSLCTLHVQRHHIWAHKKGIRVTHLVLLLFIRQSTNVNYANVWYTLKSNRLENACIWRHFSVIFCGVCVCVCLVCVWQFQCSLWARYTACTEHQTPNTQPNQCNAMHI